MDNYIILDFLVPDSDDDVLTIENLSLPLAFSRDYRNLEELNFDKASYKAAPYQKIYLAPGVSIPRTKLLPFAKENNISIVRDPKQADVIFGSNKTAFEILTDAYYYQTPVASFKLFVAWVEENSKLDSYDLNRLKTCGEVGYKGILCKNRYTYDLLFGNNPSASDITYDFRVLLNTKHPYIKKASSEYADGYRRAFSIVQDEHQDLFKSLATVDKVNETSLVACLNSTDSIVITKEVYNSIKEMFDSSDYDNHLIAMEIMANSNYQDSLFYLCLLFFNYGHRINGHKSKNHVNFKSLRSYIGADRYCQMGVVDMVKSATEKDLLTVEFLNLMEEYCKTEIITACYYNNAFTIKTITLIPEYLQHLNVNHTINLVNDFVPVVIEEPEVIEVPEEIVSSDEIMWN